jgi:hypothetical protein
MIRPIRNRKKVVAARATERGIAGHKAAMAALGNASGWERYEEDHPAGPMAGKKAPATNNRGFAVGAGHAKKYFEPDETDWDSMEFEDKMHHVKVSATTAEQRDKGANYGRK